MEDTLYKLDIFRHRPIKFVDFFQLNVSLYADFLMTQATSTLLLLV